MATKKKVTLDLGQLQDNMEQASKNWKGAHTNMVRSKEAFEKADAAYSNAKNELAAGVDQLKAATKVA